MLNPLVQYLEQTRPLSAEEREAIERSFERRTYKEDEYLFHNTRPCNEIFFICNGVLRIVMDDEKGNRLTYFFLREKQFCTILNSFNNQTPTEESIQAACDAEVLAVTRPKLLAMYEAFPPLKELINGIMQQALLDKIELRNGYRGLDAAERYQRFLQLQSDVVLRVPLSDIASYLGITQQSLSRIRKNLR